MKLLQEKVVCYFPHPVNKCQKQLTIQIPAGELGAELGINSDNKLCVTNVLRPDSLLHPDDILEKLDKQPFENDIQTTMRKLYKSSHKQNRKLTIQRLVDGKKSSKKKDQWRNSEAKEILLNGLIDGNIPLSKAEMAPEDVYALHAAFQKFPYTNFRTNLNNLCKDIAGQKQNTQIDESRLAHDRALMKREMTQRGYAFWPESEAKQLLIQDLKDGIHNILKPKELHQTRPQFLQFPLSVFRDHIHQELRALRERPYWLHKKKMKQKQARGEDIVDANGEDSGAGGRLY